MKGRFAKSKLDSIDLHQLLVDLELQQTELEAQNTEFRQTQQRLEESHNCYAELYDFAPVAYLSLDSQGCIRRHNQLTVVLLGRQGVSLVGMPLASLITPGSMPPFFEHLRQLKLGRHQVVSELALTIKNRPQTWVRLTSVPSMVDSTSGAYGRIYHSALIDVTEQKTLEDERMASLYRETAARAEAESLNRAKDEFLATVSHELRTPIQSVLMWSQLLQTRKLKDADVNIGLATIEQSVRTQSRLIESLLDVSRLMLGKLDLELTPLDLGTCLQSAFDAARPAAEAKLLRIAIDLGSAPVRITGDGIRLQQIFGNLLTNSIKFTDAGGLIQIAMKIIDSEAQITFTDTGIGISKSDLPLIFERFACSNDCARRGLGLGLTVARDLVGLHGGTISATSAGAGKGATVTVALPLAS